MQVGQVAGPLFRCVLGPLAPTSNQVEPACVRWDDRLVARLAQGAYERRDGRTGWLDPTPLAVLADALEDAGNRNAALTDHLRSGGPHESACWVIDLLRNATSL